MSLERLTSIFFSVADEGVKTAGSSFVKRLPPIYQRVSTFCTMCGFHLKKQPLIRLFSLCAKRSNFQCSYRRPLRKLYYRKTNKEHNQSSYVKLFEHLLVIQSYFHDHVARHLAKQKPSHNANISASCETYTQCTKFSFARIDARKLVVGSLPWRKVIV